jgi:dynein heavy chain
VFFSDAVKHLGRLLRILKLPFGHGLLIGLGGSGRSSLTHLAAHIKGF